MDKITKKKLKLVLIAFIVIIIPLSYLVAIAIAADMVSDATYEANVLYPEDKEVIIKSISTIDKAVAIYPWNRHFYVNKAGLQMDIQDYRGALNSAKKATKIKRNAFGFEFLGYIYEFLEQADSAKICYKEAIEFYKKELSSKDNCFTSRNIALLYTIIGDKEQAKNYLPDIEGSDNTYNLACQSIDFYIEHYNNGGLRDYTSGVTVDMYNDSIIDQSTIDSLLHNIHIYHNGTTIYIPENTSVYKFKTVFMEKAKTIGFKVLRE